jgi:hypothetical protein
LRATFVADADRPIVAVLAAQRFFIAMASTSRCAALMPALGHLGRRLSRRSGRLTPDLGPPQLLSFPSFALWRRH